MESKRGCQGDPLVVMSRVPLELTTDLLTLQEQETETSLQSEYVFLSVIFN